MKRAEQARRDLQASSDPMSIPRTPTTKGIQSCREIYLQKLHHPLCWVTEMGVNWVCRCTT